MEVTIDIIIHATEDVNKFYNSFEGLFCMDQDAFIAREVEGHFNNPILMLHARISNDAAAIVLEKIASGLPKHEREMVLDSIDERMDSSGLHLRISKQGFVRGRIALEERDAIKIRIYKPVYRKKETIQEYKGLLNFS